MKDQIFPDRIMAKKVAGRAVNARAGKITLLGLIAATYFMVAGGPYGLEDIVQKAGYLVAILALLLIPFLWSLPTALMVSELSSTFPQEGGYYIWVRRALGPFWGFQEAWLSLAASIFDMAIYPILFVAYLGSLAELAVPGLPWREALQGTAGMPWGLAMIGACVLMNLRPPRSIGRSSFLMTLALLGPFVVVSVLAVVRDPVPGAEGTPAVVKIDYVTALLFALWNYMGWDNATTFAGDVERPQRTYPLAMAAAVGLVMLTYVLPVLAVAGLGIAPSRWETGGWVMVAETVGGRWLAMAIGLGGMISAFGMFNSLVLSYSRLPVVLAEDGYLPSVFTRRLPTGVPWVAVVVCAVVWSLATQLGLTRVLALDVMLYGLSLLLEFAALVALRLREPHLERPFRIPGGLTVAVVLGLFPALLIGLAIVDQAGKWEADKGDPLAPAPALLLGTALAALGPVLFLVRRWMRKSPLGG